MNVPPPAPDLSRPQGLELARRIYVPRVVGVLLCTVCILGSVLGRENHPLYWILGFYTVLIWPSLAFYLSSRSRRPLRTEFFNLWIDAFHAGFWIVAIQFSLVPSAALFMATSLSYVTVGGLRFLGLAITGILAGMVVGLGVWGFEWAPASTLPAQLAALPLLVGYPLLMGKMLFGLTMQLKRSRRELRYLSEHDFLSGVRNRRFFDDTLRATFSQFRRQPRALSLVICDVDGFKQINDGHGHTVGDEVIRHVGAALRASARDGDVVARLGGDEFVVLLADADAEAARGFTRRVQQLLDQKLGAALPALRATLSFGVAVADASLSGHEAWLEQADRDLYQHKRHSRPSLHGAEPLPLGGLDGQRA